MENSKHLFLISFSDKAKKLVHNILVKSNDNQKVIRLNHILRDIESKKEKANEVFKKGDYDEALKLYNELTEIDPNNKIFNATIFANKALCYQKQNKLMDALREVNKAIKLNPNYTKAYMRRGNVQMALKNFEEAKYDYQKVKDLEPSNY